MAKLPSFASLRHRDHSANPTPNNSLFPPASFSQPRESIYSAQATNRSHPNLPTSSSTPGAAYSSPPTTTNSSSLHPFSAMPPAPLPVVSNQSDAEDEQGCPVCLEPLSFSFRLPGEKPHIVPECGHALHEACFVAVYGPAPARGGGGMRKANLGVCGVCRRPMKVGDGDGGQRNKLAALTGMSNLGDSNRLYPGSASHNTARVPLGRNAGAATPTPYDPTEDDPIDHTGSVKSGSSDPSAGLTQYIVAPSIQVRSESNSITRSTNGSQPFTCIVTVELPSRRNSGHVPGPVVDPYRATPEPSSSLAPNNASMSHTGSPAGGSSPRTDALSPIPEVDTPDTSRDRTHSPSASVSSAPFSYNTTPSQNTPFGRITEDLRNRILDWKGHAMSGLGPLQMFDILCVRRDTLVREFYVYLFREAIICVLEEKKKTLGRFLSSATSGGSTTGSIGDSSNKGVLRLKGRIYIRHIKRVIDTSVANELSLTIDMEDERLESFIVIFKDRSSLEAWKSSITALVTAFQDAAGYHRNTVSTTATVPDMEEFGGSSKAARILSGASHQTYSTSGGGSAADSVLSPRSTISSATSGGTHAHHPRDHHSQDRQHGQYPRRMPSDNDLRPSNYSVNGRGYADKQAPPQPYYNGPSSSSQYGAYQTSPTSSTATGPGSLVTPHLSSGPSNSLTPLPHTSLDLIVVFSFPGPESNASSADLKRRVIQNTLDFLISNLGSKDRLSFVSFEVGTGGRVKKTPFLCLGRAQSRRRLVGFVDSLADRGASANGESDEFLVRGAKEEKTDVVTAVNHGLDIVLQRKAKNPISGMILVSDAADTTRRAQMDLVLARTEAANVPIHSFGYGRSHDPASLWLMSNHTQGTYTFVKDWYDLRDCLAGCVGGMMSIGLNNMKLHLKVVDGHRFKIRKVSGGPQSILSQDGRDVDLDIGELRYGEKKEMLVELELDNSDILGRSMRGPEGRGERPHHQASQSATDRFNESMGFDALAIGDSTSLVDGMMDRMIDEVPVVELDGSFYDPAASKNVSRLAHPVLLTLTVLPPTGRPSSPPVTTDPVIVRRRMELLASDMITRALVLVSRRNVMQAQKVLTETKRILHTVLHTISQSLPPPGSATVRTRREVLTLAAVRTLQSILQDIQVLSDAMEENLDLFQHDHRNFGAQQAMILRDQKSWSGRTATEKLFWSTDNSIELLSRSTDWVSSRE